MEWSLKTYRSCSQRLEPGLADIIRLSRFHVSVEFPQNEIFSGLHNDLPGEVHTTDVDYVPLAALVGHPLTTCHAPRYDLALMRVRDPCKISCGGNGGIQMIRFSVIGLNHNHIYG